MRYWISRAGQQEGPLDEADILARLRSGQLDANTQVAPEAGGGWQPITTVPSFAQAASTPATSPEPPASGLAATMALDSASLFAGGVAPSPGAPPPGTPAPFTSAPFTPTPAPFTPAPFTPAPGTPAPYGQPHMSPAPGSAPGAAGPYTPPMAAPAPKKSKAPLIAVGCIALFCLVSSCGLGAFVMLRADGASSFGGAPSRYQTSLDFMCQGGRVQYFYFFDQYQNGGDTRTYSGDDFRQYSSQARAEVEAMNDDCDNVSNNGVDTVTACCVP